MTSPRLHLTASLSSTGFHPAGWRLCAGAAFPIGRRLQSMAQTAERGMLDAVWLGSPVADRLPIDPLPLLGSLIAGTRQIGLGAAWPVDHAEPFHVARVIGTLDHLAGGRAAWIAGMGGTDQPAANFAHAAALPPGGYLERAAEMIDLVRALWDSWEDEGLLLDVASGRFADPARVHPVHHAGAYFTVRGPMNLPRPVQGNPPVVIAPGHDERVRHLAMAQADVLLLSCKTPEAAGAWGGGGLRLVNIMPILGATQTEARSRAATLDALTGSDDGPEPDILRFVGTPAGLVDLFEAWAGQCDGFNLVPAVLPDDLDGIVDSVIPIARARGLVRSAYDGTTLREHLGLVRPRSRFAS